MSRKKRYKGSVDELKARALATSGLSMADMKRILVPIVDPKEAIEAAENKICNSVARKHGLIPHKQGRSYKYSHKERLGSSAMMDAIARRVKVLDGEAKTIEFLLFGLTAQGTLFTGNTDLDPRILKFLRTAKEPVLRTLQFLDTAEQRVRGRMKNQRRQRSRG